ncbi:MAG: AraC family transcriptional regulator [Acidobacteriota bacterium]
MPLRYQDVYPSAPLLESADRARPSAAELLSLEYFEADPGEMPQEVFSQHHVLLNLRDAPHRVENWRDGVHRDFLYGPGEVIVTPAGIRSGWRWHSRSKVIVVTLEPDRLRRFAENEAGVLLTEKQLQDREQFHDPDLCDAGLLLRDALAAEDPGSAVVYESLARIFLVKLLRGYAEQPDEEVARMPPKRFRRVLDLIERRYGTDLGVEELAHEAQLSPSHFSRLFKRSLGQTPHRFLMQYRVERACELLNRDPERPLAQLALDVGFADQAHFSRTFKRFAGTTPRGYRDARV